MSAESVVFDRGYPPSSAVEGNLQALRMGTFWLRVEERFAPVTPACYPLRDVFVEPRTAAAVKGRSTPGKRVLSIVDVYRYLSAFWEAADATSRKNLVAYDAIVELSYFGHATLDSLRLVNSVDGKHGSRSRDEADKDARTKDFSDPEIEKLWSSIAKVFDRANGRVRIWGADDVGDTPAYGALIRAALAARGRAVRDSFPGLTPPASDADRIPVADPQARAKLGSVADLLTMGRLKEILGAGLAASYASAVQKALRITTYAAPLGTSTAREQRPAGRGSRQLLFAVPKSLENIIEFHKVSLGLVLDPQGRRYAVLGPRPNAAPKPKDAKETTSPIAGVHLFFEHSPPFVRDASTGREKRDPLLQRQLDGLLASSGFDYRSNPLHQPAIAFADISGSSPYPYAATSNDAAAYYSGSLLKVAALFAVSRARRVFSRLGLKVEDLAPYFSATIVRALDFSRTEVQKNANGKWAAAELQWEHRAPHFEKLLEQKAGELKLREDQKTNILKIFHRQTERPDQDLSNEGAQGLIRSLGYAWIDSTMRFAGFPEIWLAGDYSGGKGWPSAKIEADNDFLSAQATSAREMAALFAIIAREASEENDRLRSWLGLGGSFFADALAEADKKSYKVEAAKVGLGTLEPEHKLRLKPGGNLSIYSEGIIIVPKSTGRRFAVVWQNCQPADLDNLFEIVRGMLNPVSP